MPKTKFENIVFTLFMSFLMVYAMICYNIALNMGGMSNQVFLLAFHELIIMCINDNLNMYINDHLRMYTSDYALI